MPHFKHLPKKSLVALPKIPSAPAQAKIRIASPEPFLPSQAEQGGVAPRGNERFQIYSDGSLGDEQRINKRWKGRSREELLAIAEMKIGQVVQLIKEDPKEFIFNFCWTLDEQDEAEPIKRFPKLEYIGEVIDLWVKERLVLIVKSRQMMMTWLMVALHLWLAMYFKGRHIFFVSKKEEDANALIDRAEFIWEHLPEWLRVPMKRKYCYMVFEGMGSVIQAVSQESDALR